MPEFDQALFASAIGQKYANQTLDSQSEAGLRGAQAANTAAQTAQVANNADAARQLQFQQGQADERTSQAQAGYMGAQTRNISAMIPGAIGAQGDASREAAARTQGLDAQNTNQEAINNGYSDAQSGQLHDLLGNSMGGGNVAQMIQQLLQRAGTGLNPQQHAKGTSDVKSYAGGTGAVAPGQEDHGKDTVPAMLRPHEAVLVPGAADAIGRDKIAALNAIHNAKDPVKPQGKGMPKPKGKLHAADGNPNVQGLNASGSLQGAQGPGTTVTSGTWGNGAPTPNQDLRAQMAGKMTTKNYAEGTHDVGNDKAVTPTMTSGMLKQLVAHMAATPGTTAVQLPGKSAPAKKGAGMPKPKAKKVA